MTADAQPAYDPATDRVHGSGWNSAARWGGWDWRGPRGGEHFRTCSFCGCIHPEDLAAETAGDGVCKVCGQAGWEACFRGKRPRWAPEALASGKLSDDERAYVESLAEDHVYDPGGWYASWADRKYGWPHKFYVEHLANRAPERKRVITSQTDEQYARSQAGEWPGLAGYEWHRFDAVPDGYITHPSDRDGQRPWLGFGTDTWHSAKFYTIHLADPAIPDQVKETIQRASGLRFTFTDDGKVGWRPYAPEPG